MNDATYVDSVEVSGLDFVLVTLETLEEAVAAADFKLVAASFNIVKLTQLPRRPPRFLGASKSLSLGAESLLTEKTSLFSSVS